MGRYFVTGMKNESLFEMSNKLEHEVKYNARVKYKVLPDGSREPYEIMYCNRFVFNPDGARLSEFSRNVEKYEEYREAAEEIFLGALPRGGAYVPAKSTEKEKVERSLRRARGKLMDLIIANDFDTFCTLTLNNEKIDRNNYEDIIKKLNVYLDNRVRRSGLKYVGVPERHKNGAIHFHFLCNSEGLKLVDSGTVSCTGRKKPIKIATADRLRIPPEDRHTVYNIADWSLGFTTAIKTYGSAAAVAHYVGKYLTKQLDGKLPQKVGGRWYYSGGALARPAFSYERVSFNDVTDFTYGFECSGGKFKVLKIGDCYENKNKVTEDRSILT